MTHSTKDDNPMYLAIEQHLHRAGIVMIKKLTSGHSGFLSYSEATYDTRTANSFKEVNRLTKQGFLLEDGPGLFLFNAFEQFEPTKDSEEV